LLEPIPGAWGERIDVRGEERRAVRSGRTYDPDLKIKSKSKGLSERESKSESEGSHWKEHLSAGQGDTETGHNTEMLILY